jgi:muconate cycloisomerase
MTLVTIPALNHDRAAMAPIVSADVYEVETAFVTPYKMTEGTLTVARAVILKLTDSDGVIGWGEADPSVSFTGESSADVARVLKDVLLPAVLALPLPEPGRVDRMLDKLLAKHLFAKGAISTALLDLLGKRLNVPMSTLLGGASHRSLPVLWPLNNGTADEDVRVIDERAAQGYRGFMFKMGTSPIASEIDRVAAIETRYGSRLKFVADANQGWSRDQASEFLDGVKGSRLVFVEQPLVGSDIEGMAALARDTALPLSVDESLIGLQVAGEIARRSAASVFSIKSSKNGGPLRAQRIASIAEAFGIQCYMNSMIEFGITQAASLHHAVTIENLVDIGHAFMSTLRLVDDPTDFRSFVRDGTVHCNDRPGLGIEVDEAHVRRLAFNSFRVLPTD